MRVDELRLSIHAISDPREISEIQAEMDSFITKNSENPFLLSVFIQKTMESNSRKGSTPIVLVLKIDGAIIGVVPILITKRLGIRLATFLFDFWFSPDFVYDAEYREICMQSSLTFIFDHLKCKFTTFDLPAKSPNLQVLERVCKTNCLYFDKKNEDYLNHRIISVDRPWTDFKKSKGKHFRQEFRRIEYNLDSVGKWRILRFENDVQEQEAFQNIIDVEKVSWKKNWRFQQHISADLQLLQLWEGSSLAIKTCLGFNRNVWFLELNDHIIAYSLVIQYGRTAYIAKTSYDDRYREFYPGIYVINASVRDLFNSESVKTIDFLTNLPFVKKWASGCELRVKSLLWKDYMPNFFKMIIRQPQTKLILNLIPESIKHLALS